MTKFISDPSEIDRTVIVTKYYGQAGKECDAEKAILIATGSDDKETYRALIHNGTIYDPTSIRFPRDKQYQVVTKACFDKYLHSLTTGDYADYEKAAREYRKLK